MIRNKERNRICAKPEIEKKYKKKRTDKLKLIQEINKDLYLWAKGLPSRIETPGDEIDFPLSYFDNEEEKEEIIDVQMPWMLFTKVANNNHYIVEDMFEEIGEVGELTEFVVNRMGQIKRFRYKDYTPVRDLECDYEYFLDNGKRDLLKEKIKFDVSGDYKYLLYGYEKFMMIEKLFVRDAIWYLSYARTDIAIEYGDNEEMGYSGGFVDEDDIEDYFDEYTDKSDIDLFTYLFNRMCRMNINICVFSSDNIDIVFSNKIDFHLYMTGEQHVIAFGVADYKNIDFTRVSVDKKEIFVYTNGRLLIRKEIG